MKDIYDKYKYDFGDYILLIKSGNFYICLKSDAIVVNNIFNYKIIETKKYIKAGFPLTSLSKVIDKLSELNVNYVLVENEIIKKEKFKNNNYSKYLKTNDYSILNNRINKISEILKSNINKSIIKEIIEEIESIVCKINY